ncbi:MAG: Coenzyme synthetase-like protein, partial [Chthoniobacteraceae bacterium]|nr:Coenzyme synthetase-like protein [Chthoniobacteraceae bacterium]
MKANSPTPIWPTRRVSALRSWQLSRLRRYLNETVLPFSAHYGALFRREKLDPAALTSLDSLRRIPFTTKLDFMPDREHSDPVRDFILVPDKAILSRRFSSIARALLQGRSAVAQRFEREFRPLL